MTTIIIERLNRETDSLERVGTIQDGSVDGADFLDTVLTDDDLTQPHSDLLDRMSGPSLFARQVDQDAGQDQAEAARRNPLTEVPVLPDDLDRIDKDALTRWLAWVSEGRPDVQADHVRAREFNPELHPRGPDGKFVERPYDIPDDLDVDSIRSTPTLQMLDMLAGAGEPIDDVLSTDGIRVDGIPADANSVQEAREQLGGDGIVFQDLEAGDMVKTVKQDTGALAAGTVQKTEQVDGGPNRVHLTTASGSTIVADIPEGTTISRQEGPMVPPTDAVTSTAATKGDLSAGDMVQVYSIVGDDLKHLKTGPVSALTQNGVEVGDHTIDPTDPGVNIYPADAATIPQSDLDDGQAVVAASSSGELVGPGKYDSSPRSNFANIQTASGSVPVDTSHDFYPPDTLPGDLSDDDMADVVDQATGPEGDADDGVDLDSLNVATIQPSDIHGDDLTPVDDGDDVSSGDIVQYTPPKTFSTSVGRVLETEQDPATGEFLVEIDDGGDGTTDIFSVDMMNGMSRIDPDAAADAAGLGTLDGKGPAQVTAPMIPDSALDPDANVGAGIAEDDWVLLEDQKDGERIVGIVDDEDVSGMATVVTGDGLKFPTDDEAEFKVSRIDPDLPGSGGDADVAPAGDAPDTTNLAFGGVNVENIDPGSVSAAGVPDDALSDELSVAQLTDDDLVGQFVRYGTFSDDSPHAGKVVGIPDDGIGGGQKVQIETGHVSDPQTIGVDELDTTRQIDPEHVQDVGDPSGVTSTNTQTAEISPADFEVGELEDNPNTPTLSPDDVTAPAADGPPGEADVGVIDQPQAAAFVDRMEEMFDGGDGGGPLEQTGTKATTYSNTGPDLDYPTGNITLIDAAIHGFMEDALGFEDVSRPDQQGDLVDSISKWKGKSYSDKGQTVERYFHGGLNLPGDFRNDGLDGRDPDGAQATFAALRTLWFQRFAQEHFDEFETRDVVGESPDDDELPLYRGVGKNAVASLARDWGEEPDADAFTVRESKIGNWTTDPDLAKEFAEQGVTLKENAQTQDMIYSPDVARQSTGIDDEGEIWLTGGVQEAPPENIAVDKSHDYEITMDDMNEPPEDMGPKQLKVLANWAKAMNARDYTLKTQSQVETWTAALAAMESEGAIGGFETSKVRDMLELSVARLSPDIVDDDPAKVDLNVSAGAADPWGVAL